MHLDRQVTIPARTDGPHAAAASPHLWMFVLGSVAAGFGSLGYVALNFYDGSPREAYAHPLNTVACGTATLGLVLLSLTVAR